MKWVWFKIWFTGSGGAKCSERYVFWPDYSYSQEEMAEMVEHELSPLPGGARSVNWEKQTPSKDIIEKRIEEIDQKLKLLKNELEFHKTSLVSY